MKRVLVIEDLSCFGKCSLTVAHPIISAFGLECDVLPTAVFSTHTAPYFKNFKMIDLTDFVTPAVEQWKSLNIRFDCVYVGYLCEGEQTRTVERALEKLVDKDTLLLVDPAMADNGKLYFGMTERHIEELRELGKRAQFITPNFTEAKFLAGLEEENCPEGALKIMDKLIADGFKNVIITGVLRENGIGVVARAGDKTYQFYHERMHDFHGTGDVLTSAFLGGYIKSGDFESALKFAVEFIADAMKRTEEIHTEHYYGVMFEQSLRLIK